MAQRRTEAETFSILLENIRVAEEAAYIIGHFYKAQDDFEIGQGLLAVGEMLKYTTISVTNLATKPLRTEAGFK